jgi:hypothetical protein
MPKFHGKIEIIVRGNSFRVVVDRWASRKIVIAEGKLDPSFETVDDIYGALSGALSGEIDSKTRDQLFEAQDSFIR